MISRKVALIGTLFAAGFARGHAPLQKVAESSVPQETVKVVKFFNKHNTHIKKMNPYLKQFATDTVQVGGDEVEYLPSILEKRAGEKSAVFSIPMPEFFKDANGNISFVTKLFRWKR
jgi:hypothetical protein